MISPTNAVASVHRTAGTSVRVPLLPSPGNPAAAEDEVVLIEHRGLAGCDGSLGTVQFDRGAERSGRGIEWNPIAPVRDKLVAVEGSIVSDDHTIFLRVQLDYVERL